MEKTTQSAAQGGELMLIDTRPASLLPLRDILRGAGYRVRHSHHGVALAEIRALPPELVLLEAATNGHEICRRITGDPATCHLPVILLCELLDGAARERGFAVGAADHITRPFHAAEVLARVRTHLELSRLRGGCALPPGEDRSALQGGAGEPVTPGLFAEMEHRLGVARSVFESTFDAVMVTDAAGRVIAVNPSFTRVTGYTLPEVEGRPLLLFDDWRHGEEFQQTLRTRLDEEGHWSGEVWNRRRDGNVVPMMQRITTVRDAHGGVTNYITTLTDLSESKDAQTLIEYLAYHDAVTGLPNRILANRHFDAAVQRSDASSGMVAVMCVTIDRLAVINHALGRYFADEVLRRLGERLTRCLDETALVSRQSGDEFLLLANVADRDAAAALAERVGAAIDPELAIDERRLAVKGRVGIALYPGDGTALDQLVRCADNALHRSRRPDGGACHFYSPEIEAEAMARVEMETQLRHAIAGGELFLVYQPKISLRDGTMMGAEALLRWKSPTLGPVAPSEFIPLAEETGLILAIDSWVAGEACRQIAEWKEAGLRPVPVSINLSAQQFYQSNLLSVITDALRQRGLPGSAIEIEITEGALIGDRRGAIAVLHQLRSAGISISLDDFGTGYSSLSYLKTLPIDTLKLDKSFVDEITTSASDAAIALTVLALAHNLHLTVVAEGVETGQQFDYLRERGCDAIQGYYISKPLPAARFARLLEEGAAAGVNDSAS